MADQKPATALNVVDEAIPAVIYVDTDSSFNAKDDGQDNDP